MSFCMCRLTLFKQLMSVCVTLHRMLWEERFMAEIILLLIFLVPAMLGTAELLHILKLYIAYPKNMLGGYYLIFLTEQNAALQLHSAIERANWLGRKYIGGIIAVNSGLSAEKYECCEKIARAYNVIYCSEEEFCGMLAKVKNGEFKKI